jgi:hypothetical protein
LSLQIDRHRRLRLAFALAFNRENGLELSGCSISPAKTGISHLLVLSVVSYSLGKGP